MNPSDLASAGVPISCWTQCVGARFVRWGNGKCLAWFGGQVVVVLDSASGEQLGEAELTTWDDQVTLEDLEQLAVV